MKVILQYWEESERGWGVRPDGCSLHIDMDHRSNYVTDVFRERTFHIHVPQEYDRLVGSPIEVEIDEDLFQKLSSRKNMRLSEVETNNLIKLEKIITKNDLD